MTKTKKAAPAKFDASEWMLKNKARFEFPKGKAGNSFCAQGSMPFPESRFAVWKRPGAWQRSVDVFEIVGESAGRYYGFVVHNNWSTHVVRQPGAAGAYKSRFSLRLEPGYMNRSECVAVLSSYADAAKVRDAIAGLASGEDEYQARTQAAKVAVELKQRREQLIREATARIDAGLAAEQEALQTLNRKAAQASEASREAQRADLAKMIDGLGGTAGDLKLVTR